MFQKFANVKGKYSTQFMREYLVTGNPSERKSFEYDVRMEGYEPNVRKPVKNRTDLQQPMAGCSEFWIC